MYKKTLDLDFGLEEGRKKEKRIKSRKHLFLLPVHSIFDRWKNGDWGRKKKNNKQKYYILFSSSSSSSDKWIMEDLGLSAWMDSIPIVEQSVLGLSQTQTDGWHMGKGNTYGDLLL